MSSCTHPLTAWYNPKKIEKLRFKLPSPAQLPNYDQISVNCNRCEKCQAMYSRDWAIRSVMEMKMYDQNTFLTLTYAEIDENNPTLKPDDMTSFIKRLRQYVAKHNKIKIRYIQCGEYGDKYHRPHHHALIFGYDFPDLEYSGKSEKGDSLYTSKILDKLWGHGSCQIGEANIKSAMYIAGYIGKKIYGSKDKDGLYIRGGSKNSHYSKIDKETGEEHIIHKEYMTMSRMPGLGHAYYKKWTSDIFPTGNIHIHDSKGNANEYPIPRYFFKQLAADNPALYLQSMQIKIDAAQLYQEQHPNEDSPERLKTKAFILRKKKVESGRPMDGIKPSFGVPMQDINDKQHEDKNYQNRLTEQKAFEQKHKLLLQSKNT